MDPDDLAPHPFAALVGPYLLALLPLDAVLPESLADRVLSETVFRGWAWYVCVAPEDGSGGLEYGNHPAA